MKEAQKNVQQCLRVCVCSGFLLNVDVNTRGREAAGHVTLTLTPACEALTEPLWESEQFKFGLSGVEVPNNPNG